MFAQIMSLPSDWNFTIDGLCSVVKEGRDAIYTTIKELREAGYCFYEQRREKGKIVGSDYTFYEEPYTGKPYTENPDTAKPDMEKPYTAEPYTENPTQINKEYNKIHKEISSTEDENIKSEDTIVKANKKSTAIRKVSSVKKTLQERQHDFGISLTPYLQENGGQYTKEMIRDFYNYWSEPNQAQTKMRWEMQKTWETSRRLITWANNNNKFEKNNNYGRETITDKMRRTAEDANEFINRIRAQREANLGNGDSK